MNKLEEKHNFLIKKLTKMNTHIRTTIKYLCIYNKEYLIHIILALTCVFLLVFYGDKISINKFLQLTLLTVFIVNVVYGLNLLVNKDVQLKLTKLELERMKEEMNILKNK